MRLADYVMKRLVERGVKYVFMVSGGGAMYLDDALGQCKELTYICCHHEQACAMAAEGYARASGKLGVVLVTSGPGGTNCLTGVLGQWTDSAPVLYISGQMKRETTIRARKGEGLRQLGDQEADIISIVKPITKYAELIQDAAEIHYHLDAAIHAATHGRPGPVWLDIPLDIQAADINEKDLVGFLPCTSSMPTKIGLVVDALKTSMRPVILAGHGISISGGRDLLLDVAEKLGIPVVTSFNGMDLVPSDHPLFVGRAGTIGTRGGNHAIQNADLLICIGTRNNIRQISYDWGEFGKNAKKIVVDIDAAELKKPTLTPDIAIQADAADFLYALLYADFAPRQFSAWQDQLKARKETPLDMSSPDGLINPYYFVKVLTELLPEDSFIVSGNGTASVCLHQAGKVKEGQRIIMNSGCAAMGYDLPAAIGACVATGQGQGACPVVCITGDGSIQMNIQELQTIAHHQLPIKIFVLNNNGYHSIRQTQDRYFAGRHVGSGPGSGVLCPDITRIAHAYGIPWFRLDGMDDIKDAIHKMSLPGPVVCDVRLTEKYTFDKLDFKNKEKGEEREMEKLSEALRKPHLMKRTAKCPGCHNEFVDDIPGAADIPCPQCGAWLIRTKRENDAWPPKLETRG